MVDPVRTATAIASLVRESISASLPSAASTYRRAWKVPSVTLVTTTRFTDALSVPTMLTSRSWVSGRSADSPCRRMAMAFASDEPIQIGRYRSRSDSLRMTTCWLESMCTRTLSTTISTSRTRPNGCSAMDRFYRLLLQDEPDHPVGGEQIGGGRAVGDRGHVERADVVEDAGGGAARWSQPLAHERAVRA